MITQHWRAAPNYGKRCSQSDTGAGSRNVMPKSGILSGLATLRETIDAIATESSYFPDHVALCSGDDLGAIDAREKAGAAGAIRHQIIGQLAQQGESAPGIPSHCSRR